MRDESGIALPLVMGLLVVLSLIGAGLLSQTITSTKFYESAGISYVGLWNENLTGALQDLDKDTNLQNLLKGNLVTGIGKDQNDIITIMYAIPSGNVWTTDWNQTFSDMSTNYNNTGTWTINKLQPLQNSTIMSLYTSDSNKLTESSFLFNDSSGQLKCWTSYNLHVEFQSESGLQFGVYYNSDSTGGSNVISGYVFLISPDDNAFLCSRVNSGNVNPGQPHLHKADFDTIPAFSGWKNNFPKDWHKIDVSVSSSDISIGIDGVSIFSFPFTTSNDKYQPSLVGLSNWSRDNWSTEVSFKNISVMDITPP
jgi:hypothetical protein